MTKRPDEMPDPRADEFFMAALQGADHLVGLVAEVIPAEYDDRFVGGDSPLSREDAAWHCVFMLMRAVKTINDALAKKNSNDRKIQRLKR